MHAKAVDALGAHQGFEVGVGPSVVVVDESIGKASTTALRDDIDAIVCGGNRV